MVAQQSAMNEAAFSAAGMQRRHHHLYTVAAEGIGQKDLLDGNRTAVAIGDRNDAIDRQFGPNTSVPDRLCGCRHSGIEAIAQQPRRHCCAMDLLKARAGVPAKIAELAASAPDF